MERTNVHNPPGSFPESKIGIYGWRKRCLYMFILVLLCVVMINLALTMWILRVMNFTVDGMGKLRISEKVIRVEGEAEFLDDVYVSKIKSMPGSSVQVESANNVTMISRDEKGDLSSIFYIGNKNIKAQCDKFEVVSKSGVQKLYIDENQVKLGAKQQLKITGPAGVVFKKSVQTPKIMGSPSENLKIESATGKIEALSAQNFDLSAPAGDIHLNSLTGVTLRATNGEVRLDSRIIALRNVKLSVPTSSGKQYPGAYQVCVCPGNGRLFLASSTGECTATTDVCS